MSTQATYTFKASENYEKDHTVFVHWDGYPSAALKKIKAALDLAWPLPRYESDEIAASFVAANKDAAGNVRLMKDKDDINGTDYDYEISSVGEDLFVKFYEDGEMIQGRLTLLLNQYSKETA